MEWLQDHRIENKEDIIIEIIIEEINIGDIKNVKRNV